MQERRSYAAGRFAMGIDGKFAGFIKKVSGGTIKGELVKHNLGTSNYQKKHLSTISHEPLTMEIGLGMSSPMWEWIRESWDKGFVQKNAELTATDFDHKVQAVRVFQDAYISEVTVPALDASSKEPGYFSVKLDPKVIRYQKGDGSVIRGSEDVTDKKFLCSNFRLELGDLPCTRVAKIDSFKWEQKVVEDEVGRYREPTRTSSALEVSNLKLSISADDIAEWAEWHRSFVIDGKCTDGDELKGSLQFLSPDMNEMLATIDFDHVGIISLEQEWAEDDKESIARFDVELYVEEMHFSRY